MRNTWGWNTTPRVLQNWAICGPAASLDTVRDLKIGDRPWKLPFTPSGICTSIWVRPRIQSSHMACRIISRSISGMSRWEKGSGEYGTLMTVLACPGTAATSLGSMRFRYFSILCRVWCPCICLAVVQIHASPIMWQCWPWNRQLWNWNTMAVSRW